MKKSEQWELIQGLCVEHKANKKLTEALKLLLAPKTGGSAIVTKEPIVEDGVKKLWCTKFEAYYPEAEFNVYKGKPLHFCKEAEKQFKAFMKITKGLKIEMQELMDKILDGEIDLDKGRKSKKLLGDKIAKNEEARLGTYKR